ncbi:hypothetical protein Ddye_025946 [Dipteronia dyeriana]|uniref:AC transposase n=1 Tax=Dipteronia dyeriana TaxID=168575 RepID=A0AAD9TLS9_9ROSI|nr:hypothetical protein Ddye_025946 [Dipteronia dyeriana]
MIKSALIYKTVFPSLRQRDVQYKRVPTEEDWVSAKEISDKLEVFYLATLQFSRTKYPTANTYLPSVCNNRCVISQWSTSPIEETRRMALSMAEKFDTYWTDFYGIMVVATILDPRYKMKVIECYFPKIYGDQTSDEIQKIHDLLLRMFREYEGKSKVGQTSCASSSGDPINVSLYQSTMIPSKLNPLSLFDEFLSFTPPTNMKAELKIYLEEHVIPRVDNFDILRWWYTNEFRYPILHCIARDILAIPVYSCI